MSGASIRHVTSREPYRTSVVSDNAATSDLFADESDLGNAVQVTVDLGANPSLWLLSRTQNDVRRVFLSSVYYELAKLPEGDLGLQSPLEWSRRVVFVTTSVTFNPWMEIYQGVAATGGLAALARAGWVGIKNANAVLDFLIRLPNIPREIHVRRRALDLEATRLGNEIVREIIDSANGMATSSHQAVASRQLVYNMSTMDPEIPLRLRVEELDVERAANARQRIADAAADLRTD